MANNNRPPMNIGQFPPHPLPPHPLPPNNRPPMNTGQFPPPPLPPNNAINSFRTSMHARPPSNLNLNALDSDSESDASSSHVSTLQISIRSPLTVTGNHNLIASDVGATSQAVALGVVQALRQLSMGQHGIPMIDEQGRPRGMRVTVSNEVRIEGSGNVVGERAVLARMLDVKERVRRGERADGANTATATNVAPATNTGMSMGTSAPTANTSTPGGLGLGFTTNPAHTNNHNERAEAAQTNTNVKQEQQNLDGNDSDTSIPAVPKRTRLPNHPERVSVESDAKRRRRS